VVLIAVLIGSAVALFVRRRRSTAAAPAGVQW
jgi:hypothetical protein